MENQLDGQEDLFSPRRRTRTGDPETSRQAAESVTDLTGKQGHILELLRSIGPSTDEQINTLYNAEVYLGRLPMQSDSGLRARRSELVTLRLVRWNGEKQTLISGRNARVWEVIPDGGVGAMVATTPRPPPLEASVDPEDV